MTGNTDSTRREPLFLIDESLVSAVARALELVDYEIRVTTEVFGKQGTEDPEIIEWCSRNGAVWIHADNRAKRQHRNLIRTSGIRTVLIRRRGGAMAPREQLRILSYVLPRLIHEYVAHPRTRHYSASAVNEISKISLRPERI